MAYTTGLGYRPTRDTICLSVSISTFVAANAVQRSAVTWRLGLLGKPNAHSIVYLTTTA